MRRPRNRQITKALFKYAPRVKITILKEELNQAFQSPEALEEFIERKYEEARNMIYMTYMIYGDWKKEISRRLLEAYTAPYCGRGYPGDCIMFQGGETDGNASKH